MIYTSLSEIQINAITEVVERYGLKYEVRISDQVKERNNKENKDNLGMYLGARQSTDLLEIEFDHNLLKDKISDDDAGVLLANSIVLDQESILSESELQSQIAEEKLKRSSGKSGFEKFVQTVLTLSMAFFVGQYFYKILKDIGWFQ